MSDEAILVLYVYVLGLIMSGVVGGMGISCGRASDKRNGARIVLLSPVWPVLALYASVFGVRNLWRLSGWGRE